MRVQQRYVGLYIMHMDLLVGQCILCSAVMPQITLSSCMFTRKCTWFHVFYVLCALYFVIIY